MSRDDLCDDDKQPISGVARNGFSWHACGLAYGVTALPYCMYTLDENV